MYEMGGRDGERYRGLDGGRDGWTRWVYELGARDGWTRWLDEMGGRDGKPKRGPDGVSDAVFTFILL